MGLNPESRPDSATGDDQPLSSLKSPARTDQIQEDGVSRTRRESDGVREFFELFEAFVGSGRSIDEALYQLERVTAGKLHSAIALMRQQFLDGGTIVDSMLRYPELFSGTQLLVIEHGLNRVPMNQLLKMCAEAPPAGSSVSPKGLAYALGSLLDIGVTLDDAVRSLAQHEGSPVNEALTAIIGVEPTKLPSIMAGYPAVFEPGFLKAVERALSRHQDAEALSVYLLQYAGHHHY